MFYSCICGHDIGAHYLPNGYGCNYCFLNDEPQEKWQQQFKLDNLTLIEKLARERGLV